MNLKDKEPCNYIGCLNHITHPCEGCDRIAGVNTMKFKLNIEPAISPRTRHQIQDVLTENGYTVIGGGTMTDGSSCDISFERPDPRDKNKHKEK